MASEVWQTTRAKGRTPRWAFRVTQDGEVVFESVWVSVGYRSREDATWLAELVSALCERGAFRGCPGHAGPPATPIPWGGDFGDDCSAFVGELYLHAEHLYGPVRGGFWYCSVTRAGESLFHTAGRGIDPRSGEAARWLCEIVADAVTTGVWD